VALAAPISSYVVALKKGRISSQGTIADVLANDYTIAQQAKQDAEQMKQADEEKETPEEEQADKAQSSGKLVAAEEIEEGHVRWEASKSSTFVQSTFVNEFRSQAVYRWHGWKPSFHFLPTVVRRILGNGSHPHIPDMVAWPLGHSVSVLSVSCRRPCCLVSFRIYACRFV
jgi:hypothetical protein